MMQFPLAVGFIGSGAMATALARGWLAAGLLDAAKTRASDPLATSRDAFAAATKLTVTPSNRETVTGMDVIVLAVKPQTMPAVIVELKPLLKAKPLVISIAAGVTLKTLSGLGAPAVRVMPNTPCLIGASASAFTAGEGVTPEQIDAVTKLFGAVGIVFPLAEKLLDAVTGLSGSGPAYVYTFIEALADGGVKMGLPRDVALKLAAQTVMGAARMVLETGSHPAVLKDAVTSPGGTTIAGLHALEVNGLRAAVIDAVEAATLRATELGRS